jgi:2-polyprenyl-3-methyl-5-hydroxy-6-metoxy-1,4-benzoquinol methylase
VNRFFKNRKAGETSSRITPEDIMWAYRLFLGREPENQDVITGKLKRLKDFRELVEEFIYSEEFKERNTRCSNVTFIWDKPRMSIEEKASEAEHQGIFKHIQESWSFLGETEPHWSVMAWEEFRKSNIQKSASAFFKTGKHDFERLLHTMERNAVDYSNFKTCLEYGSGLGRVTFWLSKQFKTVYGYDISKSHLQGINDYLTKEGVKNVTLRHIDKVTDIQNLPSVDLIYSVLVLQHNPPPLIRLIIRAFMKSLKDGGIAFFQVPTYKLGYNFCSRDYLKNEITKRSMEMHVLPQSEIFTIVMNEGGRIVEVIQDDCAGPDFEGVSNTFLVQKNKY